jgi:hypothetical protein
VVLLSTRILAIAAKEISDTPLAGDDDALLSAYMLASGPMDLYYRSKGIPSDIQAREFARVVGKRVSANGQPVVGA